MIYQLRQEKHIRLKPVNLVEHYFTTNPNVYREKIPEKSTFLSAAHCSAAVTFASSPLGVLMLVCEVGCGFTGAVCCAEPSAVNTHVAAKACIKNMWDLFFISVLLINSVLLLFLMSFR